MRRDLSPKDKHAIVQSLWTSVNEGGAALKDVPLAVKNVLISEAWREREWNGRKIEHKTFRAFIETPPIEGCGWPLEKVEKLIKDDAETLAMWRDAVTPPVGTNQHHDNIMTQKAEQGTSKSYTVSRLKREAPELFQKVARGELSANAAAIKAGLRKPPPKPFEQVKKLIAKLTPEERQKLKEML